MAPRINPNQNSTPMSPNTPDNVGYSLGNAALGAGQVFSLRDELLIPRGIAPRAATLRAWLPRIGGAALTVATSGYDMLQAFRSDQSRADGSYTDSRRQFFSSMTSISAGLGVGSLAGGAASVAIIMGAPVSVGIGISALGVAGAVAASKYAYDWAQDFGAEWIR